MGLLVFGASAGLATLAIGFYSTFLGSSFGGAGIVAWKSSGAVSYAGSGSANNGSDGAGDAMSRVSAFVDAVWPIMRVAS